MHRNLSALAAGLLFLAGAHDGAAAQCAAPSFAAARSYAVGSSSVGDPRAAAGADFNGDHLPDVVTANSSSGTVSVLLGSPAGGLTPATNFGVGSGRPVAVAVGDFNGDNKPDVVTANSNSDNVSVLLGDGAGGFGAATPYAVGPQPTSVLAADLDGDGHADLAVAVRGTNEVRLLKGTGAGTFTPTQTFPAGDNPRALAAADFNTDGRPDIAVANFATSTVSVIMSVGATPGTFAAQPVFLSAGTNPEHVAAGDLNGDGKFDLAVANYASANVSILIGGGDGSFAAAVNFSTGSPADSVAIGDFNDDGRADFAAGYTAGGVSVRLGSGAGAFGAARRFDFASGPVSVVVDDFTGDGSDDIAAASYGANVVSLLAGDGAGNFTTARRLGSGQNVISTAVADFNNDGNVDVASANENQNTVSLRLGDGAGGFAAAVDFATATRPYSLALGDFNNDGAADLVTANFLGGGLSVLLGNGAGSFAAAINVGLGNPPFYPYFVAVGEFNGDGKQDLALVRDGVFNNISVLLGDGAGNFGAPTNFAANTIPRALAVGDFNGDGKADLAVVANSDLAVLLGNGAGGFGAPAEIGLGVHAGGNHVIARDLNGDGKLDLVTSNNSNNNLSVLLGDGAGGFAAPVNYAVGLRPEFVTSADFNGDGLVDLAAVNDYSQTVSVLLGNGAGAFGAAAHWAAYPFPTAASVADFDEDGRADIIVGGSGGLALLLNTCGLAAAPALNLSVGDATLAEGDSGTANAVFQVSLSAPSAQAVTVDYRASGDTAAAGADFQPVAGTLTFAPGETSRTVEVPVVGDLADEFTEVFRVGLYHPTGARIAYRRGVGSITDTDPVPAISINDVSAPEGDFDSANFVFTVSLSAPSGKSVVVNVNNADGTAVSGDYFHYGGPYALVFAPGETTKSVTLMTRPDFDVEADEHFFVNLAGPENATIADAQGVGTIQNDDFPPTVSVSINDVSVVEGNSGQTDAVFTVSLSGPTTKTVKVDYSASDGSGTEHGGASGTLTFAPGETSKTFVIKVTGDARVEGDEQFEVRLHEARNALMGDAVGILTVVNDDAGVSMSISDATVTEGDSGTREATFTVSISAEVEHEVTYLLTVAPGTAASGEDFFEITGGGSFGPGFTTRTHTVPVRGDTIAESSETFFARLSDVEGATVADAEGVVTILDNDSAGTGTPSFQFAAHLLSVSEGGREATVTVTRSGDASAPAGVGYLTEMSNHFRTASERSDYTPALGVLHFAPGETSKTFKVLITDDAYDEGNPLIGDESIDVRLSDPTGGAVLGSPSFSSIIIVDNDAASGPSPVRNEAFDAAFFVRQHYADFLNRQPDDSGLAFWVNQITECEARPEAERQGCREVRRINVSGAFFLSVEFQETGYLVHRAFGSAFGTTRVGGNVPLTLREFLRDTQEIGRGLVVNAPGWEQVLEQNKARYFDEFVRRAQFTAAYPSSMTAAAFVDALNANTSGSLSQDERDALVAELSANMKTRAQALRAVAEDDDFGAREKNRAFVLMQYFGYLRRNPNEAPEQNLNFDGYNFWLTKLNQFGGNHVAAEMIKGFITSGEYQQRFGQ